MRFGFSGIFGKKKKKRKPTGKKVKKTKKETRKRPIIDPITRRKVLERDNYQCQVCGVKEKDTPEGYLEMDHSKRPWSEGGATTLHNLQALCKKCNQEKGNKWRNLEGKWKGHSFKIPKEK